MKKVNKMFSPETPIHSSNRSPRTLRIAALASLGLGVANGVAGIAAGSNALGATSVGLLDNAAYEVQARASYNEHDREKNHKLRKLAGAMVCGAAVTVGGFATYDLINGNSTDVSPVDIAFPLSAAALNGGIAFKFYKHAHEGTTHRDAFRHAAVDTIGSLAATAAIIASMNGVTGADSLTAIAMSGGLIIATYPTKKRMEAADGAFVPNEATKPNAMSIGPSITKWSSQKWVKVADGSYASNEANDDSAIQK